ncbi:MAG TPA: molybdate ABC transporter substrate-binding protein [Rubellimicrobium sp.]|jgi:molybdate transport system substrate-binding protein|nr:molybdate ABC transporter substrate-binding protein [Rubellimicrobium sp.]
MRLAFALALLLAPPVAADEVTVFAAARLRTALDDLALRWEERSGEEVTLSYAGTRRLVEQILEGAPADLFISNSQDWMDELQVEGAIDKDTRVDLLGNRLVLLAHGESEPIGIGPDLDLAGRLDGGPLAMALVDSIPAGFHGKRALTSLGFWDEVEPLVAEVGDVHDVVEMVARGRAPLGIVYASDAAAAQAAGDYVSVLGAFPAGSHAPVIYPAALIAGRENRGAGFLAFLSSEEAEAVFESQGFTLLPPAHP